MPRGVKKPAVPIGDPADPHSIEVHIAEFVEWMGAHGYSESTITGRRRALRSMQRWLAERGVVRSGEVTRPMLERYQRWLFHHRKPNGQPLTFLTQRGLLSPVRSFFSWAARTNRVLYNPASELELPRVERRLPKHVLTVAEVETVMSQPDISHPGGVRDRAILEVLYSTGIRRGEAVGLRLFDIDFARRAVHVREGKGRRDRIVPIGERALVWVDRWLTDGRSRYTIEPDEGFVFIARDGGQLSRAYLTTMVGHYVTRADVGKTGSCHLFRHTMATLMLDAGADIRFIQAILGHAKLSTTQIYTQVTITQLLAIHDTCHPGARNHASRDRHLDADEDPTGGADIEDREAVLAELLDALDDDDDRTDHAVDEHRAGGLDEGRREAS
jgi:integrase/recombinase XerD